MQNNMDSFYHMFTHSLSPQISGNLVIHSLRYLIHSSCYLSIYSTKKCIISTTMSQVLYCTGNKMMRKGESVSDLREPMRERWCQNNHIINVWLCSWHREAVWCSERTGCFIWVFCVWLCLKTRFHSLKTEQINNALLPPETHHHCGQKARPPKLQCALW